MKQLFTILLTTLTLIGFSQSEQDAKKFAETILQADLKDHLTIVASDAMEGRETGQRGQKMAAAYIKYHFQSIGLTGPVNDKYGEGYYQKVVLYKASPGDIYFKNSDKTYVNFDDVVYYGSGNVSKEFSTEVVFAGSGTEEELAMIDYKDKSLLIVTENWRSVLQSKPLEEAMKNGAKMAFVQPATTDEDFETLKKQFSRYFRGGRLSVENPVSEKVSGIFFISPTIATSLTGSSQDKLTGAITDATAGKKTAFKKIKNFTTSVKLTQNVETVETENVLGFLEGTDKKDEIVIITSHYDHIGKRGDQINNGADDDGSGTVSLLEIAEAFATAKKEGNGPRRSILFMTVTGEEKGLLGSDYYTKNPIFPLENTVVNLNIDMVGRVNEEHKDNRNYIYLIGSNRLSTELHELSEMVNKTFTKIDLDYTYNDEAHPDRFYYRSDHWNFAKNNIPIIFYFNGVHDDYHQPSDTVDKIEFDLLEERARLVFYTGWMIANRDKRLVVDVMQDQKIETK